MAALLQQGRQRDGFTIVELLIVIVVIAILAAITIVAFNGIQDRGNNAKRRADLAAMAKSLELYYVDNGRYPATTGAAGPNVCLSIPWWNCWGAGSANRLVPVQYASTIPQDSQFVDDDGCSFPNPHRSRMYSYRVKTDGSGYQLGSFLPGLSSTDPNYNSANTGDCTNFVNYILSKNYP